LQATAHKSRRIEIVEIRCDEPPAQEALQQKKGEIHMSVKSVKAVLAVVMVALMLGPASLLWVAADSHGALTELEPGAQHWYTLAYPGSGTVEVRMDVDPAGGAAFMIVTTDAVRAWEAGAELVATGRGANNPNEEADLFWSGSFGQAGNYSLVVEYSGDGSAPSFYSLDVGGAEVSSAAAAEGKPAVDADGVWCYEPDLTKLFPIGDPHPAPPPGKAFVSAVYDSVWTGYLSGESADTGFIVAHLVDAAPVPMIFVGTSSFTNGTVGGASGGLELDAMGERPDPTSEWWGTWRISSGTGDLEDLQAHGTFWGPGWPPPEGGSEECPAGKGVIYYSVDD
jgi:hypothetical protein